MKGQAFRFKICLHLKGREQEYFLSKGTWYYTNHAHRKLCLINTRVREGRI